MASFTILIWERVTLPKTPPLEIKGCPPPGKKTLSFEGNGRTGIKQLDKSPDSCWNQKNNNKSGISQYMNIFKIKG